MYEIIIHKKAQKELMNIDDSYYERIKSKIKSFKINPRPLGCIKLTNSDDYRVRIGHFRILYSIDDE